jgi:RNase P/RNase MRP subunit p30
MSGKMPFMLKRNPVYEALRKGKYFELQYDSMFEDNSRVICMTNMINTIKATNAKNIIVTSHANGFKTHRTPYDVAALMTTLGLNKNLALAAMKENAEIVIKGALHRQFFKGTIKEIPEIVVKKIGKKIQKHR